MALFFTNNYSHTIWIAFAYYDPSCGPENQNFRKLGWWQLDPSQMFDAWDVDLRTVNRYAYFYAESADDEASWSGNGNAWLAVDPNAPFDQCAFVEGNDSQWVDFSQLDFALPGADLSIGIGPIPGEWIGVSVGTELLRSTRSS
jgi:hypothetical protein